MKQKVKYDREYLGVTITSQNYREILEKEGRDGINFHSKHLRAYLKGYKTFQHGYERDDNERAIRPRIHKVMERIWKTN